MKLVIKIDDGVATALEQRAIGLDCHVNDVVRAALRKAINDRDLTPERAGPPPNDMTPFREWLITQKHYKKSSASAAAGHIRKARQHFATKGVEAHVGRIMAWAEEEPKPAIRNVKRLAARLYGEFVAHGK